MKTFQSKLLHRCADIYQDSNICQVAKLSQDVYIYQNIHVLSKDNHAYV